jgi:arylsulfatase
LGGVCSIENHPLSSGNPVKRKPIDAIAIYSADETADVGIDESTPVAGKVFKDVGDTEFTGRVNKVTISIPPKKK